MRYQAPQDFCKSHGMIEKNDLRNDAVAPTGVETDLFIQHPPIPAVTKPLQSHHVKHRTQTPFALAQTPSALLRFSRV
ncbi:hypothetical protein P6U16_21705 (plasmid) [Rhizobium sp. 32-5/1]|uniref:hypothetical protein n=1 Tax=Rhizobium sp. 32-5/1 TaxID=3019602 RepID=UPI00240D8225|nr:hypothetical protein [Rhizobium sp. 32-5/1]WEZ85689.1 hypothetical protein P6U16_21705 [Rhizobium sp. 32-5/1]